MNDDTFTAAREFFTRALAALQAGQPDLAEPDFRACLALLPGRPSTLINLAVALLQLGRPAEALPLLDEVLTQAPQDVEALGHRGLALNALHRHPEAHQTFSRLLALAPERPEAWFHQAQTLQMLGQLPEALAAYDRCLALQPEHAQAWSQRGGALKDLGRRAEAITSFERAITLGADAELNRYYLAPLRGDVAPPAAPRAFVEGLFDDYADGFDRHLVDTLGYRAPEVLAQWLVGALAGLARGTFESTLDLGCGTGLCGPLLRPMTQRLSGVDLSSVMLDAAQARDVYDTLTLADLSDHLASTDQRHDLIVAADVFIYVGDLAPVFSGAQRVLQAGGVFAFSAEIAPPDVRWLLQPSLRYAHGERYLRQLAAAHGLHVQRAERGVLRLDQGKDLPGLYVLLVAAGH